jgi:hypothetical protein
MDDQQQATATDFEPSAAQKIMTVAGFRREAMGGNVEAWRKDLAEGEFELISADGECDADPLATVWTAGRYRDAAAGATIAQDPHHTNLARAIERLATLTVQGAAPADLSTETSANVDQGFQDQPDLSESEG